MFAKEKIKQVLSRRSLITELLFTLLIFAAMAFLSYAFMRGIVRENLARNAESVFDFAQSKIESTMSEPKMRLSAFSQSVRGMILRGDGAEAVYGYTTDYSGYTRSGISGIMSAHTLFGYYEALPEGPLFIAGSEMDLPDGFDPTSRPWFSQAVEAGGEIVEVAPYYSYVEKTTVVSYTRAIFDDQGRRLGVAAMNIRTSELGRDVAEIASAQDSNGMLFDQNYVVISHTNPEFIGIGIENMPVARYADRLRAGEELSELPMEDWRGNDSVIYTRRLANGWVLALVTPEHLYFSGLTRMTLILGVFFAVSAAVLMAILIRIDAARTKSDMESRHKSAFLANMSHEIRTPMNAIIGMTTIGKTADNILRKDYCFKKIEDASNHLLGVINDILDMSKIEANKFELAPVEFNFEKMLQRVVNVVIFRVDEKHQKFSVHIDKDIPKNLIGDDQRIAQVITNLLGNAVKFTPENGSIRLDTRFLGMGNDICHLEISVSDTGIGINEEQQERLFMSFEQAESSTTRKYGGTGLGLAISRNIVEQMGGKIWVESRAEAGSTFTFTIHVKRSVQKDEKLLSQDINFKNLRIMAVDDDKDILDYFAEIANGFGVSYCDIASSGEEALGLLVRNENYHIFFIDWRMPVMDGIQLAAEIKKRTAGKSVVIMISAAEWTSIEAEATKAGVDKFLAKPLFPSDILNTIMECISLDFKQIEEANESIDGIFSGRRILLAEDVEINREIVQALLEPTMVDIDIAENGAEAVRMFREAPGKYDAILMDIQMPVMDGYEATSQIRALKCPEAKSVSIVAMTANVFRDDIERCLEVGMDNHIGKPVDFQELVDKLRAYIQPRCEKNSDALPQAILKLSA